MGGFGSGQYSRWSKQDTIEEHRRTDIGYLAKQGFLEHGAMGTISWSCGDEPSGSITVRCYHDWLVFSYTLTMHGEEPESIKQRIYIERTPCHFGGSRPWFTCLECDRRVGVLIGAGRLFLCRICHDLPYGSQMESDSDRASRRIRKIQKRLGNSDWENVLDVWFPKPKGMHWKTYNRIVAQADKPLRMLQSEMAGWGMLDWAKLM